MKLSWSPFKICDLSLRLKDFPIPVLALREGALPGTEFLSGYIKYTNPSVLAFAHGSAALYANQDLPQCCLDTSSLPFGGH